MCTSLFVVGCLLLVAGLSRMIVMNYFEFSEVPKRGMMNGRLCSCARLQYVLIASAKE